MGRRRQTRLSVYVITVFLLLLSAVWTMDRIRIHMNIRELMNQPGVY